jgi:hypothetical protein
LRPRTEVGRSALRRNGKKVVEAAVRDERAGRRHGRLAGQAGGEGGVHPSIGPHLTVEDRGGRPASENVDAVVAVRAAPPGDVRPHARAPVRRHRELARLVIRGHEDGDLGTLAGPIRHETHGLVEREHLGDDALDLVGVGGEVDLRPLHHQEEPAGCPFERTQGGGRHLGDRRLRRIRRSIGDVLHQIGGKEAEQALRGGGGDGRERVAIVDPGITEDGEVVDQARIDPAGARACGQEPHAPAAEHDLGLRLDHARRDAGVVVTAAGVGAEAGRRGVGQAGRGDEPRAGAESVGEGDGRLEGGTVPVEADEVIGGHHAAPHGRRRGGGVRHPVDARRGQASAKGEGGFHAQRPTRERTRGLDVRRPHPVADHQDDAAGAGGGRPEQIAVAEIGQRGGQGGVRVEGAGVRAGVRRRDTGLVGGRRKVRRGQAGVRRGRVEGGRRARAVGLRCRRVVVTRARIDGAVRGIRRRRG